MDHSLWFRDLMTGLSNRLGGTYAASFDQWSVTGRSDGFVWRWAVSPVGSEAWVLELAFTPTSFATLEPAERAWSEAFRETRWWVSHHDGALHLATRVGWTDRLEVDSEGLERTHHHASAAFERARRLPERTSTRPPAPNPPDAAMTRADFELADPVFTSAHGASALARGDSALALADSALAPADSAMAEDNPPLAQDNPTRTQAESVETARASTLRPPTPGPTERVTLRPVSRSSSKRPPPGATARAPSKSRTRRG